MFRVQMPTINESYKNSGWALRINLNDLNEYGSKEVKVLSKKKIRFNVYDATFQKEFNPNYEFYEEIIEIKTDLIIFRENITHLLFNGKIYDFLDRVNNNKTTKVTARFGFKGLTEGNINYVE